MRSSVSSTPEIEQRNTALGAIALLGVSAAALAIAPAFMPDGYRWVVHTTSESAAQGLEGAWVARLGFLTFGFGALSVATASQATWARSVVALHTAFGVLMIATAAFSHAPWLSGVPFDPVEDLLHSITATAMGFAFAFGVVLRLLHRWGQGGGGRVLDAVAAAVATVIPLTMAFVPEAAGLVQRLMFLVAYVWYGSAALELVGPVAASRNPARHRAP